MSVSRLAPNTAGQCLQCDGLFELPLLRNVTDLDHTMVLWLDPGDDYAAEEAEVLWFAVEELIARLDRERPPMFWVYRCPCCDNWLDESDFNIFGAVEMWRCDSCETLWEDRVQAYECCSTVDDGADPPVLELPQENPIPVLPAVLRAKAAMHDVSVAALNLQQALERARAKIDK